MNGIQKRIPGMKPRQSAQSMVEFALVLPILLLVMLGLFAFGHLLFSYTLVTAASREAARFGVATGLSDSGVPRFRDCDAIRAAAVRAGSFAGVSAANVTVEYDRGPKLDGSPADLHADACPAGGIGPGYINIGDRIVVTVDVDYRPIVPLRIIPDIDLTSVTRRTIIRTLPIGDAPVAPGSQCIGTISRIFPPGLELYSTSKYGQTVSFTAQVIADDPDITAPGTIRIYEDDPTYTNVMCSGSTPLLTCNYTSDEVGEHVLRVAYDPGSYATSNPCYDPSKAEPWKHTVEPADTTLRIVSVVDSSPPTYPGDPVAVTVEVQAVSPGAGIPTGPVVLMEGDTILTTFNVGSVYGHPGVARGTGTIQLVELGTHTITAIYDPVDPGVNENYNASLPVTFDVVVEPPPAVLSIVNVNPKYSAHPGQTITMDMRVSSIMPGYGTPSGPVTLMDGTELLQIFYVSPDPAFTEGVAIGSVSFKLDSVGTHQLTLIYDPSYIDEDPNFSESAPLSYPYEIVKRPPEQATTETVILSVDPPPPTSSGEELTITVIVSSLSAIPEVPTGTVVLKDNGVEIGRFFVETNLGDPTGISSIGTFVFTLDTPGLHVLTAVYDPAELDLNPYFNESTSLPYEYQVIDPVGFVPRLERAVKNKEGTPV